MLVGKQPLFSSECYKELKKTTPNSSKDTKKLKSSVLQRGMTGVIVKLVENINVVHLYLGHIARQHIFHAEITKLCSCYNEFITHYINSIAWKFQQTTTKMKECCRATLIRCQWIVLPSCINMPVRLTHKMTYKLTHWKKPFGICCRESAHKGGCNLPGLVKCNSQYLDPIIFYYLVVQNVMQFFRYIAGSPEHFDHLNDKNCLKIFWFLIIMNTSFLFFVFVELLRYVQQKVFETDNRSLKKPFFKGVWK